MFICLLFMTWKERKDFGYCQEKTQGDNQEFFTKSKKIRLKYLTNANKNKQKKNNGFHDLNGNVWGEAL